MRINYLKLKKRERETVRSEAAIKGILINESCVIVEILVSLIKIYDIDLECLRDTNRTN